MKQVIHPAERLGGVLRAPGDRSITVRAVLLGAIAEGESAVSGHLESDDTAACMNAMRALGVHIDQLPAPSPQPPALRIRGASRAHPDAGRATGHPHVQGAR